MKQEIIANPLSSISTELALALRNAIEALQGIEKQVANQARVIISFRRRRHRRRRNLPYQHVQ